MDDDERGWWCYFVTYNLLLFYSKFFEFAVVFITKKCSYKKSRRKHSIILVKLNRNGKTIKFQVFIEKKTINYFFFYLKEIIEFVKKFTENIRSLFKLETKYEILIFYIVE